MDQDVTKVPDPATGPGCRSYDLVMSRRAAPTPADL